MTKNEQAQALAARALRMLIEFPSATALADYQAAEDAAAAEAKR